MINNYFFSRKRAVYEIMWKSVIEPHMHTHLRIAYWIPAAISTHPEYVTIICFPPQQWMHETASKLR